MQLYERVVINTQMGLSLLLLSRMKHKIKPATSAAAEAITTIIHFMKPMCVYDNHLKITRVAYGKPCVCVKESISCARM